MNIAIIHDWLTGFAGMERVLEQLVEIYPKADIFTSVTDSENLVRFRGHNLRSSFLQKIPLSVKKRQLMIPLMPYAFENLDLGKYDLVISNSSFAAKGVITKVETPHICYCHTPTRYLWESHLDNRASGSALKKWANHNLLTWDRLAALRPDYFIANSENIKKKIWKYYRRESRVVYPPVDTSRFKPYNRSEISDYYLCVGRLVPYKKVDLVIRAFNDLKKPLYVVGTGPEQKKLKVLAKSNIKFLGRLPDKEQAEVYGKAKAFVFPADEDFGIVPIEALASGRPVIAYASGGALETIKEGINGTFFKEQTPQCLIDTIRNFDPDRYDPERLRQTSFDFDNAIFRHRFKETVDEMVKDYQKNGPPLR